MTLYVATRTLATRTRQYEGGDLVDVSRLTQAEWIEATESGALVPARFVGTTTELVARNPVPGPGVPVINTTTGTVRWGTNGATAYNALPDAAAAAVSTQHAADVAAFAHVAGADAAAPHVQLGPIVKTKRPAALSVLALQNNDASAPDNGTRLYIVPRAATTTGVGGVLKIFADDYTADQTNYRDFGLYFSQDQVGQSYPSGDLGTRGHGCFYLNTKSAGTEAGYLPDLVFSMQDGTFVAARMALATVSAVAKPIMVIGPGHPEHGMKRALVLEMQGDIGFDGAADRAIYWETTGGTSSNKLDFQRTASGGSLKLTLGGAARAQFTADGGFVLGDQAAALGAASTVGFFHIRGIADTPSGVPSLFTGSVPLTYDITNNKLWAYNGGWKSVTLA